MVEILTRDEIRRIEMNVMSVGCSDSNARRLLDHAAAALDERDKLREALHRIAYSEGGKNELLATAREIAWVALAGLRLPVADESAEGRQAK